MSWFSGNQPPNSNQQSNYSRLPEGARQNYSLPSGPRPSSRSPVPPQGYTPPQSASRSYAGGYGSEKEKSANEYSQQGLSGTFKVERYQSQALTFTNCLIVNDDLGSSPYVLVKGKYPFKTKVHPEIPRGSIGASNPQRKWAQLSFSDAVDVRSFNPFTEGSGYLGSLDLEVSLFDERKVTDPLQADSVCAVFLKANDGIVVSTGLELALDYQGVLLKLRVKGLHLMNFDTKSARPSEFGVVCPQTDITILKDPTSQVKVKSSAKKAPPNAILQPNFKFEDMGIGGLDSEFSAIFRRAFASRIFPPGLVDKLGIQHVKGILLFGPPGTGKTLMARQIGKMLNAKEPKVVNGPEILNKFVGQSEENIRKLFADAEKEYKAKGDESDLHIIIFDELDAICKQRGSTGGGTGVGDSIVNQLLSKMDGVDQLNNILIIGMTNRLDMIDEALLRPGRLEVHMEISLPDEKGRVQILNIHTEKMRQNNVMASDVDLLELAAVTKNFSGAEIGGLIKSATSFAFNRHVKVGTMAGISDDIDKMQVNRSDFLLALDEVKPAFGVAEEELQQVVQNGIVHFNERVSEILQDGKLLVEQVRTSSRTPLVSALVHGPPGSGKTALAASVAIASEFPFIKLISPENMVGFGESQKINYINKVFNDSYKSPLSVIVIDSLERILEWVPIGPRFSNPVLQAIVVLLGKTPPKGRRLLILCTTSIRPMLTDLNITEAFATDISVPAIKTLPEVEHILREARLFGDPREYDRALRLLAQAGFGDEGRLFIGVKRLLNTIEMARQASDPASKLVESFLSLGL
ncbi:vesicular-fusion protein SEC18 [Atractiella rhizophila]|nr:vesicular-fusion protein SEC18 [Atractiella rhizophila]